MAELASLLAPRPLVIVSRMTFHRRLLNSMKSPAQY